MSDVPELDPTEHLEAHVFDPACGECIADARALDWFAAVRKFGWARANEMFRDE
jgi:hypothetical protein